MNALLSRVSGSYVPPPIEGFCDECGTPVYENEDPHWGPEGEVHCEEHCPRCGEENDA